MTDKPGWVPAIGERVLTPDDGEGTVAMISRDGRSAQVELDHGIRGKRYGMPLIFFQNYPIEALITRARQEDSQT